MLKSKCPRADMLDIAGLQKVSVQQVIHSSTAFGDGAFSLSASNPAAGFAHNIIQLGRCWDGPLALPR